MKTLQQLASELQVRPDTLRLRLRNKPQFEPDGYEQIPMSRVKPVYGAQKEQAIKQYLKSNPIGQRPGPKLGSHRRKAK